MALQDLHILPFPPAVFDSFENPYQPGQSLATRSAPATGFPREKARQIMHEAHRAGAIVEELQHPREVPSVSAPTWDECAQRLLAVYREVLG